MIMFKYILILLIVSSTYLFSFSDMDMDGVDDNIDKCLNTPMTDLVNNDGCSIESLVSNHHFDIVLGSSYSTDKDINGNKTDTFSSNIQLDYYYKKFSIQLSTFYYDVKGDNYQDDGMNDTTISVSYKIPVSNNLNFMVSTGVICPTYSTTLNNNNADYFSSINATYSFNKFSISSSYIYTMINDDDIKDYIYYQNTNAYSASIGYSFTPKFYAHISYFNGDSIYIDSEDIKNASLYLYYSINEHIFTSLSYGHGISDSAVDNFATIKIGYYF